MEKKIYFTRLRPWVFKGNRFLLVGYAHQGAIETEDVDVVLISRKTGATKETSFSLHRDSVMEGEEKAWGKDMLERVSLVIDFPEDIDDEDIVKVSVCGSVSFSVSGKKAKDISRQVVCQIIDTRLEKNKLVVKGWVTGGSCICIHTCPSDSCYKGKIDPNIKYEDAEKYHNYVYEVMGYKNGFIGKFKNPKKPIRMIIETEDKMTAKRIGLTMPVYNSNLRNRIDRYVHRICYNLTKFGLKGTVDRTLTRIKTNSKKEVSYDGWLRKYKPKCNTMTDNISYDIVLSNEQLKGIQDRELYKSLQTQKYSKWRVCEYNDLKSDYVIFPREKGVFLDKALYLITDIINETEASVIYGDEDFVSAEKGEPYNPWFKPDFNRELLASTDYLGNLIVIKRQVLEEAVQNTGDFFKGKSYEYMLKLADNGEHFAHIPELIYRSEKPYALTPKKHTYPVSGEPLVSIIIPNKDHIEDLDRCLKSIESKLTYSNYEIIIIENNSTNEETYEYYRRLQQERKATILYWEEEFNFSAINNFGAALANGEYLLFLNNDTEIITGDMLERMVGYCQREDVGMVGPKLYYEDGTIQTAGVILGMGGIAGHALSGLPDDDRIYMNMANLSRECSALTAACVMIKKSVFEQAGYFNEEYKVAFNDIDLCLKVRELGLKVIYDAYSKVFHYESKSRGSEDTPEKQNRFFDEIELFNENWSEELAKGDPYYNPHLSLIKSDYSL